MDVTSTSALHAVGGSGHHLPSTNEPETAMVSTEEFAIVKDVASLSEELTLSLSLTV